MSDPSIEFNKSDENCNKVGVWKSSSLEIVSLATGVLLANGSTLYIA
jgi:hypothetical protein